MLDYGINFNVEEGAKKAQKELEEWNKKWQDILKNNPLKVDFSGVNFDDLVKNTNDFSSRLSTIKDQTSGLQKDLPNIRLGDGIKEDGRSAVDVFNQLKHQAGEYGGIQQRMATESDKATESIKKQNATLKRQSDIMVQLKSYAMNFLSVYAGIRLTKNMVAITGEFEAQRISLQAILRDAKQGEEIFNRIKGLAVESPFMFKDLVSFTKQLSAFSVPYEELYDTTKMLADVSAGLGVEMSRIILAFGQVRSASVLRGQELRQFTEAGIPLVDELAKKFTELKGEVVSTSDVFDLIAQRQVPFEMIRDIFADMTSEGGKFYKMQEKLADTLKGKVNNLTDAFQIMLHEMGEKGDGVLKGSIDSTRWLIENYEEVGRIIVSLAATYGIYRTAIIASAVAENGIAAAQLKRVGVVKLLTAAQSTLNKVMALNPYVLVAAGVALLGVGLWNLAKATDAAKRAQEAFTDQLNKNAEAVEEEKREVERLIGVIKDDTETRSAKQRALTKLQSMYPAIFSNMDIEAVKIKSLADLTTLHNEAIEENNRLRGQQAIEDARRILRDGDFSGSKQGRANRKAALSIMGMEANEWNLATWNARNLEDRFKKYTQLLESSDKERLINEYNSKTDAQRVAYIDQRIKALEKEKSTLESQEESQWGGLSPAEWKRSAEDIEIEIKRLNKQRQELLSTNKEEVVTADKLIAQYNRLSTAIKNQQELLKKGATDEDSVRDLQERQAKIAESLKLMGIDMDPKKAKDASYTQENAMVKAEERLNELRAKMALEEKKYALEVRQVKIDAMEDGTAKELAQIELTKDKDLQAIEERKQAMINANLDIARARWESEGKPGDVFIAENYKEELALSESQISALESMKASADLKEMRSKELMFENLLNQYKDYAQKVKDIEEKKVQDIKNLNEGRTSDNSDLIDRAISEVGKKAKEETASLAFDEIKNSEAWRVLFSDLENYTVKTLKRSLEEVSKADISNLNPADAKAVQQAIDKMRRKIDEKNPFFALKDGWEQFIKATKESPDDALEAINRMIKGAQDLLGYFGEFQSLMDSAFGAESGASFWTNTMGDFLTSNVQTGGGMAKILMGDLTGIKDVIKGVTGYINVFRNIRNRKYDKEIERQEKVVKSLEEEYKRLGKAMEDSLGSDYYKNATKQAENLKGQVSAISKQIEAEKKKGKDTDEKKIADLEQQRQDLMLESAQVVEDAIERLTGTNLTSAAEDFAKAWMDAYVSFGDTTEAMQKRFGDMMQNMIVNAMLSSIMQRWLKSTFDMIDRMWADGVATPDEIAAVWREGQKAVEGANSEAEATMEILKNLGLNLQNTESNLTGITKGISSITEDTALILGGYLNSIRDKLFPYIDYMMAEHRTTMSDMLVTQRSMAAYLVAIEGNTKRTAESNDKLLDRIDRVFVASDSGKGFAINVNA